MAARFLSIAEAAEVTGLSENYLYDLAHGGHLPVVRIGRKLRISEAQLTDWMNSTVGDPRDRVYPGAQYRGRRACPRNCPINSAVARCRFQCRSGISPVQSVGCLLPPTRSAPCNGFTRLRSEVRVL